MATGIDMTYGDLGMFYEMVKILEELNGAKRLNKADGAEQLRQMAAMHGG